MKVPTGFLNLVWGRIDGAFTPDTAHALGSMSVAKDSTVGPSPGTAIQLQSLSILLQLKKKNVYFLTIALNKLLLS